MIEDRVAVIGIIFIGLIIKVLVIYNNNNNKKGNIKENFIKLTQYDMKNKTAKYSKPFIN